VTLSYLDHNATSPVRPEVAAAMEAALALGGNASSVHAAGRAARRAVENAREAVAALVGAEPERVVFTGGGTEANNLALKGAGRERVLVSAIEHDSVLAAAPDAERIPVRRSGVVDLDALVRMLAGDGRPALVSVMLANNETGILQPVQDAARIAHAHGALFHCDAVQAAGKISVKDLGADLVTLSAHKLGGPQGVGALVLAHDIELRPLVAGGRQEGGFRAGTENVAGIVGFGVAAGLAMPELASLRDRLEAEALRRAPEAVLLGAGEARLPNTSCIALPGIKAETQVIALDLDGVMVSAGSACSSGKVRASHVLEAMGAGPELAGSAIRVSLGWSSTQDDVECFLAAWAKLRERSRGLRSAA
jgi:cysteine desulfurase